MNEKIDLIYSLGYVYNPYDQEFFNPFINKGLKAVITYNLDLERIENLHNNLEKEFLAKNQKQVFCFSSSGNSLNERR